MDSYALRFKDRSSRSRTLGSYRTVFKTPVVETIDHTPAVPSSEPVQENTEDKPGQDPNTAQEKSKEHRKDEDKGKEKNQDNGNNGKGEKSD